MKIAIMQPYFIPYIGYFQLIRAVDKFIFYDDVNFIKNGWINRNRILLNGEAYYITIQLKEASSFKLIKEINFTDNRAKLLKTIENAYRKAPLFNTAFPLVNDIFTFQTNNISELAIYSVKTICRYLNIATIFQRSSECYSETKNLNKADRLISICNENNANQYINPIGGTDLYTKSEFTEHSIDLFFLKSKKFEYNQFTSFFFPGLSIIDIIMFNSAEEVKDILNYYELI